MIQVGLLTQEQTEMISGQTISENWYYSPIMDCHDDWIISQQEIDSTTKQEFLWIKQIPIIDYCEFVTGSTENYVGS